MRSIHQSLPVHVKANKSDELAALLVFNDRQKQYQQFLVIKEELQAIGIEFGNLIGNRGGAKGWRLNWEGFKAGLFWTVGNSWSVDALKPGDDLSGMWEEFDLHQQLECNGINLDSEDDELVA